MKLQLQLNCLINRSLINKSSLFQIHIHCKPLKRQSRLQQTTNFATSFLIFKKSGMIFHENRLPADDSHEYHALFVIFVKATNLQLSSAPNYRWRFKG